MAHEPPLLSLVPGVEHAFTAETLVRLARTVIRPDGALLLVLGDLRTLLGAPWNRARSGIRVVGGGLPWTADDLAALLRLAQEGAIRPAVDRTYDLDEVVEAHRYVDTGRKRGAVVLRIPA